MAAEKTAAGKTIVMLVSVGSSVLRAKSASYDLIRKELEEHTGHEVLQVFSDDNTAKAVDSPEDRVYTVEGALEEAVRQGAERVVVVPVFMTKGQLYNEVKSRTDFYLDRLHVEITEPVLHDQESCRRAAALFQDILQFDAKKEYLIVDHGNPFYHCTNNTYLEQAFRENGSDNIKVIQLKERDSFGQAVAFLKARRADETGAQVVIVPLIVAWGDYMADELYNSEDSFMWKLRNAGYRTVFTGMGMGEFPQFRKVYSERYDELGK